MRVDLNDGLAVERSQGPCNGLTWIGRWMGRRRQMGRKASRRATPSCLLGTRHSLHLCAPPRKDKRAGFWGPATSRQQANRPHCGTMSESTGPILVLWIPAVVFAHLFAAFWLLKALLLVRPALFAQLGHRARRAWHRIRRCGSCQRAAENDQQDGKQEAGSKDGSFSSVDVGGGSGEVSGAGAEQQQRGAAAAAGADAASEERITPPAQAVVTAARRRTTASATTVNILAVAGATSSHAAEGDVASAAPVPLAAVLRRMSLLTPRVGAPETC